jgi:hypothetical protein
LASGRIRRPITKREWSFDQDDNPSLEVVAALEADEERTFEVDVPELVRSDALIARAWRSGDRATATAEGLKEMIDLVWADLIDLAPAHLHGNPLRVPVAMETDGDDDGTEACT